MKIPQNNTACAALLEDVEWTEPRLLIVLSILILINFIIIVGNFIIISAVFCFSKLRSVTNLFIVSLAVADLLIGVAVFPFSIILEILKKWIYGQVWCQVWLALDVWMCTASILNLCVISLDRYVGVTRPITYPSIMTYRRAKLLIAGVWVVSFVICFPPLVGWRDTQKDATNASLVDDDGTCICELPSEAGYVVYSALGSFFIPTIAMLFFYWKIYKEAVRATRATNQGFRKTKDGKGIGNRLDEQSLTLHIHRRKKMETKAAKHLGIMVGGFLFCWLPFFTMYLIRAFCKDCIPPLVFSIHFWLGYCNSAINPLMYALFSKDFECKQIICKCFLDEDSCPICDPSDPRIQRGVCHESVMKVPMRIYVSQVKTTESL